MIYVALSFLAGVFGAAAVWFWWGARSAKAKTRAFVENELNKVFEQAKKDIEALPDPERKMDPQEVANALERIRARGREPL